MFRSRDLWKVNSKDHAVAAPTSTTGTNSATALHHYRGLNFEGMAPPSELLGSAIATLDELRRCILAVDRRWRLDAIVALDDYLS